MAEPRVQVSDIVTSVTGLAFVYSVLNVSGLSSAVGFPILNFMSVTDYLSWSIRSLTPVLFWFAVALIVDVFLRRTERGLSEEEIAALTPDPAKTLRRRRRPWIFTSVICAAAVLLHTIAYAAGLDSRADLFGVYMGTLPVLWYTLASWYLQVPRLTQNWTRVTILLFYFVPALLLYSYFEGLRSGSRFYEDTVRRFELTEVSDPMAKEVRVLLVLDKYILLSFQADPSISAIPTQNVERLRRK